MNTKLNINCHHKTSNFFSQQVNTLTIFIVLATTDFVYQYMMRDPAFITDLKVALFDALLYTTILWVSIRLDLARTTLCFLALPYLIFIPGWLNTPTAVAMLIIFLYCLIKTLQSTTCIKHNIITRHDLLTFMLILAWVNLSGSGGYGFQHSDYRMNNARLMDLVKHDWPMRYGPDQNFVYYMGYFMPSAILGKLSNLDIAVKSMYIWTVIGVTLAIRWVSFLSQWQFTAGLVLIFVIFGPLDIFNLEYLLYVANYHIPFLELPEIISRNTDMIDFSTAAAIHFRIGNYLSNTFQLYWSPQQIIAGWLSMGLVTHLYLQDKGKQLIFIYALLCLWGPLIMIAMFPLIVVAVSIQTSNKWHSILSLENTLGAGTLALLFITYYLGGSAGANQSDWIINVANWQKDWHILFMFYFFAWGLYALVIAPFISTCSSRLKIWFGSLLATLLLLSIRTFGEWNDLLCRGSAPLMFLLLIFILRAIHYYWHTHNKTASVILVFLLISGSGSAFFQNTLAISRYGDTQPFLEVFYVPDAEETFGKDNSIFERFFRKKIIHTTDK